MLPLCDGGFDFVLFGDALLPYLRHRVARHRLTLVSHVATIETLGLDDAGPPCDGCRMRTLAGSLSIDPGDVLCPDCRGRLPA